MRWLTIILMVGFALPAAAEVLDTKQARKALFSLRGYEVQVSGQLGKQDAAAVRAIVPLMAKQLRQPVRYYAAIAWSPDDGLVHEALQAAMNFHTVDAAKAAAIAACMPLRSSGAAQCRIAAVIVPKRYKPRDLTLSIDATAAFDKTYRKAKAPKAFAISPTGGGWGMGLNDAAAIKACAKSSGDKDCEVVIRD